VPLHHCDPVSRVLYVLRSHMNPSRASIDTCVIPQRCKLATVSVDACKPEFKDVDYPRLHSQIATLAHHGLLCILYFIKFRLRNGSPTKMDHKTCWTCFSKRISFRSVSITYIERGLEQSRGTLLPILPKIEQFANSFRLAADYGDIFPDGMRSL
jgi:hypothetical protein